MMLSTRTAEQVASDAQAAHQAAAVAAIHSRLEAHARAMGYSSALSLATYTTSPRPDWRAEAEAFVAWRDAVWTEAHALLSKAQATGRIPSIEDVLAALPAWPDAHKEVDR